MDVVKYFQLDSFQYGVRITILFDYLKQNNSRVHKAIVEFQSEGGFCYGNTGFTELPDGPDRPIRPETLEVEPEEEVDTDEKGPYILQSEVKKAIKEIRNKKATGDDDVPGDVLNYLEKVV